MHQTLHGVRRRVSLQHRRKDTHHEINSSKNRLTSLRNSSNSARVGGRLATIYPKKKPERNRIIIYEIHTLYMLCLGFICMLFGSHACNLRYSNYRQLSTQEKIEQCYKYLHILARVLNLFYSSQHILKHFSVVHPNPYALLWLLPETKGFSTLLSCSMIHPYLGLAVACTYDISILESIVILGTIYTRSSTHK